MSIVWPATDIEAFLSVKILLVFFEVSLRAILTTVLSRLVLLLLFIRPPRLSLQKVYGLKLGDLPIGLLVVGLKS